MNITVVVLLAKKQTPLLYTYFMYLQTLGTSIKPNTNVKVFHIDCSCISVEPINGNP